MAWRCAGGDFWCGSPSWLVWLAFCGFAAGAAALGWALQGLLGWRLLPIAPGLCQVLLTAGLYPCLAGLLTRAHEAMVRAEAAP